MYKLDPDMFRQYRPFEPGEFILCFIDTAGEGQDACAGHFLSKTRLDIPLVLHYQGSITDVTPVLRTVLDNIFTLTGVRPVVAYETNNGGGYELERLSRLNKQELFRIYRQYVMNSQGRLVRGEKLGMNTNSATRGPMLIELQDMINNCLVAIYDEITVTEMFSFVKHKTPSGWRAEAEEGSHDDLVMALGGVWQMYQTEKPEDMNETRGRMVRTGMQAQSPVVANVPGGLMIRNGKPVLPASYRGYRGRTLR